MKPTSKKASTPWKDVEEDAMADLDLWFLADPDRIEEYWEHCPEHIRQEYREQEMSRSNYDIL